jgi:hypothetical protein
VATGTYAPDPDLHVVDANGVPVSGGLVWTYIAGTTTPTPTYTDVGLLQPNTNPIVAGSDGRFVACLVGGMSYKFVYEMPAVPPAHGAVIATRDNILAVTTIAPGTGGGVEQATYLTGTVNDFPLVSGCSALYCYNTAPLTITGLAGGVPGQRVTIFGTNAAVTLPYVSASSLAGNRLVNVASSAPTMIATATVSIGSVTYLYDGGNARWLMVTHEQNGWITPPFNAADFAGTGGGTWTVAAPAVQVMKYRLSGKALAIVFQLAGTTIAGPVTSLIIRQGQFGGYRLQSGSTHLLGYCTDAGLPLINAPNDTQLGMQKGSGEAFVPTAGLAVYGTWFGEVI